jgi:hypothetical protein
MAIKRWNANTSQWELVGTPGTATPAAIGAATLASTGNTFLGVQTITSSSEWPLRSIFNNTTAGHRNHILLQRSNNNGAVTSGFNLGGIAMSGHDGTNYGFGWNGGAEISAYASQTWTSSARGTSLAFLTTPDSTTAITERMRITSNGKLLFGNNSEPANPYSVHITGGVLINQTTDISPNASAAGQLTIGGNGYSGYITLDGTAMHIGHNSGARALHLGTDETARMVINGTGDVGIGINSPTSKLHINHSGNGNISGPTSGTWAAKVVQKQDTLGFNGLSVQNRWGGSNSIVFEAAIGWNGSEGYFPALTVNGIGQTIVYNPNPATESAGVARVRNIALSTSAASGGNDGDVWFTYT